MNEEQQIEMSLWSYIDGNIDDDEKLQVEQLLQNNTVWQNLYKQLLKIRQLMNDSMELDEPSMRFTKNVMEQISKLKIAPATKNYINKKVINSIGAFFMIMIGGLLIYSFTKVNWSVAGNNTSSFDFSKFDLSKYFTRQFLNIFLMLNVVLGLILFDGFFTRKESKHKHS